MLNPRQFAKYRLTPEARAEADRARSGHPGGSYPTIQPPDEVGPSGNRVGKGRILNRQRAAEAVRGSLKDETGELPDPTKVRFFKSPLGPRGSQYLNDKNLSTSIPWYHLVDRLPIPEGFEADEGRPWPLEGKGKRRVAPPDKPDYPQQYYN